MNSNTINSLNLEKNEIYKTHKFLLHFFLWSLFAQFFNFGNFYQPIAIFLPCLIYLHKNKCCRKRILKTFIPIKLKVIPLIFLLWISNYPLSILISNIFDCLFQSNINNTIIDSIPSGLWQSILFVSLFPSLFEELLVRGIVLDGYRNKNIIVACLMNGFIFGMIHLNFYQFSYCFILGCLSAYLVFITKSIFSAVLIHFINNTHVCISIFFEDKNLFLINFIESSISNPTTQYILLFALSIIGLIFIYFILKYIKHVYGDVDYTRNTYSKEKIFNAPLICTIIIFSFVGTIIQIVL